MAVGPAAGAWLADGLGQRLGVGDGAGEIVAQRLGELDGLGVGVGVADGVGLGVGVGHEASDGTNEESWFEQSKTEPLTGTNALGFDSEFTNGTAMYCASVVPNTVFIPTWAGLLPSV